MNIQAIDIVILVTFCDILEAADEEFDEVISLRS